MHDKDGLAQWILEMGINNERDGNKKMVLVVVGFFLACITCKHFMEGVKGFVKECLEWRINVPR